MGYVRDADAGRLQAAVRSAFSVGHGERGSRRMTRPDAATEALAEIAERARRRAEKDRALTIRWLVVVLVCLAALCWFAWFTQ